MMTRVWSGCVTMVTWLSVCVTCCYGGNTVSRDRRADGGNPEVAQLLTGLESLKSRDSAYISTSIGDPQSYTSGILTDIDRLFKNVDASDPESLEDVGSLLQGVQTLGFVVLKSMQNGAMTASSGSITLKMLHVTQETFEGFQYGNKKASISLPKELEGVEDMVGITAYIISDLSGSLPGQDDYDIISSDVIGCHVMDSSGGAKVVSADVISVAMETQPRETGQRPACVTGDVNDGSFSDWSENGCQVDTDEEDRILCKCTHLSNFAILLKKSRRGPLTVLAYGGCGVTFLCCLVTALVIIGYRLMASTRSYIRTMFLVSLGSANAAFMAGMKFADLPGVCTMAAVWLHFVCMGCFTWLLVYTLFLGDEMRGRLPGVHGFDLLVYNSIGWGVPFTITIITLIWRYRDYRDPLLCWISSSDGMEYAFIAPSAVTVLVTFLVLMYVCHIYRTTRDTTKKILQAVTWLANVYILETKAWNTPISEFPSPWPCPDPYPCPSQSGIRSCMILLPMLSATWLLAVYMLEYQTTLLQLLFTVINTILGLTVFIFMCFFNEEIRLARRHKRGPRIKKNRQLEDEEDEAHKDEIHIKAKPRKIRVSGVVHASVVDAARHHRKTSKISHENITESKTKVEITEEEEQPSSPRNLFGKSSGRKTSVAPTGQEIELSRPTPVEEAEEDSSSRQELLVQTET